MARKRAAKARPELIALLDACKDEPEDAPRLVLADWLDEHGDESDQARAEFVRSQLERAKLDDKDPLHDERVSRERELLRQHARAWMGPLAKILAAPEWESPHNYRHGLFRMSASLDALAGTDEPGLAASEAWAWVYSLTLGPSQEGAYPEILHRSPLLGALTELCLDWARADGDAGLASLLASRGLSRLRSLSLRGSRLARAADLAAGARRLTTLTHLDLSDNPIGDRGALGLASSDALGALRKLDLTNNAITEQGRASLLKRFGQDAVRLD